MRNLSLFALLAIITLACIGSEAVATLAPVAIVPGVTPTRTVPPMLPSATPNYQATAARLEAIVTAEIGGVERGRLALDATQAAHERGMDELNAARQHELDRTRTAAEAFAIVSRAQVEASATVANLQIQEQQAGATGTAQAQVVSITQVSIDSLKATQTADAPLADIRRDAQLAELAYTATVESGRLAETMRKQRTGTALLQVFGWSVVLLMILGVLVVIGGAWNRQAVQGQITLAHGSIMKAGDKAIQHDGARWSQMSDTPAPDAAKPVKPIPIYGVNNPGPVVKLSETGAACLEVIRQSIALHGEVSNHIAGYRDTTGSGDTWTERMNALQVAGVEMKRTKTGTFLMNITLGDLAYDIETGKVRL